MQHPNRLKLYLSIWGALFLLTALEVGAANMGLTRYVLIAVLVGMSAFKAALVALFYMHLWWEKAWLGAVALLPFAVTATFAAVLIAENSPH